MEESRDRSPHRHEPAPGVARDHEHRPAPSAGHDHGHDDGHDHAHGHDQPRGWLAWLGVLLPFGHGHQHDLASGIDAALETNEQGIRALKQSLLILGATAAFQVVIVLISGSVALLADTLHNLSDALTAVPLWIAFTLGRRPPNRRYTYGYGRAEDIAGLVIVVMIALSAAIAAYESYQKFLHPEPISQVGWVMVASLVGFAGNELVAVLRIRVGQQIGSAALVADGQHARVDGLTSLAVLIGAIGVLAGYPLADPIVGVLITVAILFIAKDAAVSMWRRLMDAVEPELVTAVERTAAAVAGVQGVHDARMRWVGHRLQAEVHILVDEDLSTRASHRLAEEVRHALLHAQPRLSSVMVHVDPCGHGGEPTHAVTAHHMVTGAAAQHPAHH